MSSIDRTFRIYIIISLSMLFLVLIFFGQIYINEHIKNISNEMIETNITSKIKTINLSVTEKQELRFGFGITYLDSLYFLQLSDGTKIRVDKNEFDKYEENKYYDFAIIEEKIIKKYMDVYK